VAYSSSYPKASVTVIIAKETNIAQQMLKQYSSWLLKNFQTVNKKAASPYNTDGQ
jgi:hypothetical protein